MIISNSILKESLSLSRDSIHPDNIQTYEVKKGTDNNLAKFSKNDAKFF